MKSWFVVVLYLFAAAEASAQSRTRPLDPLSADTFEQAVSGSALVRDMVRRLEASDLVVHIETSRNFPSGVAGTMRFVTSRGGYRYVRISLAIDIRPEARAAILGHELQHACELAASDAHDIEAVRRLYQASGHHPFIGVDMFETDAALLVERQVRAELRADTSRQEARSRPKPPSRQAAPSRQAVPSRQEVPSRQDR